MEKDYNNQDAEQDQEVPMEEHDDERDPADYQAQALECAWTSFAPFEDSRGLDLFQEFLSVEDAIGDVQHVMVEPDAFANVFLEGDPAVEATIRYQQNIEELASFSEFQVFVQEYGLADWIGSEKTIDGLYIRMTVHITVHVNSGAQPMAVSQIFAKSRVVVRRQGVLKRAVVLSVNSSEVRYVLIDDPGDPQKAALRDVFQLPEGLPTRLPGRFHA